MIQKLPAEIIREILGYLREYEIKILLFLCKSWYPVVCDVHFRRVRWYSDRSLQKLKQKLSDANQDDNDTQLLKAFPSTETLIIGYHMEKPTTELSDRELLQVFSLFPNLKCLNLADVGNQGQYLWALLRLSKLEKLPPLEELVLHDKENSWNESLKFKIFYQLRRSLKRLTAILCYHLDSTLLQMLSDFEKLTTLNICSDTYQGWTIFNLLQACPNLSSLVFTSKVNTLEDLAQEQLSSLLQESQTRKLSLPQFLRHLKSLKLTLHNMPRAYIDFLLHLGSNSLSDFDMYFPKCSLYKWMDDTPVEDIHDLCRIVRNAHTVRFRFNDDLTGAEAKVRLDRTFQFVKTLTGERVFRKRKLTYKMTNCREGPIDICFAGSELSYIHTLMLCKDIPVPHDKEQLAKVDEFMLVTISLENCPPEVYLDYVNRYCPQLVQLRHKLLPVSDYKTPENLRGLFARDFLIAKCTDPSNSTLNNGIHNMTQIRIDKFELTEEMMDQLKMYYTGIKVLILQDTFNSFSFRGVKVNFDFSKLKCLETFVIAASRPELISKPFLIHYSDGSRTLCYSVNIGIRIVGNDTLATLISADDMQEEIEKGDTLVLYIKGSDQLARIDFRLMMLIDGYERSVVKIDLFSSNI